MGRLAQLPPYLFSEIDAARQQAEARGLDVIDLGIGDPDRQTPAPLLRKMADCLHNPVHHRYPSNLGSAALRETIADWFQKRHGCKLDPDTQIQVLIGSKEGLAHLPLALLGEGDEVLVPDVGYPVYQQATILAGGRAVLFPLRRRSGFLPERSKLEPLISDRTRLLYLNYPNNPTGATATAGFFRKMIDLAAERAFAVAHDAAYLELFFGSERPPSLLRSADLARDRVIEFHSFSKMFNMTGWRIGFAAGHRQLIGDLGRVKQTIDSGVFGAIQQTVTYGLRERFDEVLAETTAVYPPRRVVLIRALQSIGCEVYPTEATFYVWARPPGSDDSVAFCRRLLSECGVVLTPGTGFGPGGEGWFRASLTAPDERIAAAAERLGRL